MARLGKTSEIRNNYFIVKEEKKFDDTGTQFF